MYILNGKKFDITESNVIGENQYPAGYFAGQEERDAFGVIWIDDTPPGTTVFQDAIASVIVADGNGGWRISWTIVSWSQERIDAYLSVTRAAATVNINAERDRRLLGGVNVLGNWFDTSLMSRSQYAIFGLQGINLSQTLDWTTLGGTSAHLTPQLVGAIIAGIAAQDEAIMVRASAHRAAMRQALDPAVYNFSGGWPDVFTG